METFDIGETVICSCEVRDESDDLIDPATAMEVEIKRLPPKELVVVAVTSILPKDDTGKYHYDYQSVGATPGTYQVEYIATDGLRITRLKDTFGLV